jgi:hypothetical protein
MSKCVDDVKPPHTTFFHPRYMLRFTSSEAACSTTPHISRGNIVLAAKTKQPNKVESISYFSPQVFLAGAYNILNLGDLVQWTKSAKSLDEDTVTRVMDMVWDGLLTKDTFDDPEQFELLMTAYKDIFNDISDNKLQRALQGVAKQHLGSRLSYHSRKSYHKIIKKLVFQK